MAISQPASPARRKKTTISSSIEIEVSPLFEAFTSTLQDLLSSVRHMSNEEAQDILKTFKDAGLEEEIETLRLNIVAEPISNILTEEAQFQSVAQLLVHIYDDLQIAADTTPVDETSPGYRAFLKKMVTEAESEPAVFGRKALFSFLEE